jgi:hypothetical protein
MATHVCNGVYQLAYFISKGVVTQRRVVMGYENSFIGNTQSMYVALMIRQKDHAVFQNLFHLYSGCGFSNVNVPESLVYGSSTVYSPYPFLDAERSLQSGGYECNAMYREVMDDVAFSDDTVELLDPRSGGNAGTHFVLKFHSFPLESLAFVKENGLITKKHAALFGEQKDTLYFSADEAGLFFENNFCDKDTYAVFVVKARYFDNDGFVNSSLPSNMAVFIGSVPLYKEQQLTTGVKTFASAFSTSFKCLISPKIPK